MPGRVVSRAGFFCRARVRGHVGLGFGSCKSKVDKNFGLNSGLRRAFLSLGSQKYNQNNLAALLNSSKVI